MASLLHTGLANVWNLFFQIQFQGRDEHPPPSPELLKCCNFGADRRIQNTPTEGTKKMLLTNEAAAPLKLVVMLIEQTGVRFVAV